MATADTPSQRRLADALRAFMALQGQGRHVLRSDDLSRLHREALLQAGYIRPIIKGWYRLPGAGEPYCGGRAARHEARARAHPRS